MVILSLLTITTPVSYTFSFFPINSASFSVLCHYLLFSFSTCFFPSSFFSFCFSSVLLPKIWASIFSLDLILIFSITLLFFFFFSFFCWEMSVYIIYLLFNILLLKLETWNCVLFLCAIIVYWHPDKKKMSIDII